MAERQDGSSGSIHGRRYDAAGNAIGGEFQVNTFTPGFQYRPRVGRASNGRFVVSWTSYGADGTGYAIAARRFDPSGNPIGSEFVVNTYTTGDQFAGTSPSRPTASSSSSGRTTTTATAPAPRSSASGTTPRAPGWAASSG